jgi:hypothetical protein
MSWEDDRVEKRPCPCDKGHYTVTYRSNDWGQHDERWSMDCSQCRKTHGLYQYIINWKGMHERYSVWAPTQDLRELDELRKALEQQQIGIATHLKTQYEDRWIEHFAGKSKKATWAELTDEGSSYPQLSTFYNHARHYGLESILKGYLRYDQANAVSRILRLDDPDLTSRVAQTCDLENRLAAKNEQVRATGFR